MLKFTLLTLATLACAVAPSAAAEGPGTGPTKASGRAGVAAGARQSAELDEAAKLSETVTALYKEGKYDEAAPLAERVVEAREKSLGPDHPLLAPALVNLGMVRIGQGRFADAEAALRRSLALYEKAQGAPPHSVAQVLGALALTRAKQKDLGEAARLGERAVEVVEKANGPEHPELAPHLRMLGDIRRAKGDERQAEEAYLRAYRIWVKEAGTEDARAEMIVETLHCMAATSGRGRALKDAGAVAREFEPIEGTILNGKAIHKPQPPYPNMAKDARVSGMVVVKILVNEEGRVTRANVICGHAFLAGVSETAARQARFTPTLLDAKPVKVTGYITYNFVR
jgi:TonB family protein